MRVQLLEPAQEMTLESLQDAISLADEVPPHASELERWTELERLLVYDWAMREHLYAGDHREVRRRPRPWVLGRLQTRESHVLVEIADHELNSPQCRKSGERLVAGEILVALVPEHLHVLHADRARELQHELDMAQSTIEELTQERDLMIARVEALESQLEIAGVERPENVEVH